MTANSQRDKILRALINGDKLTPRDALVRFSCMRLAARIGSLRDDGHEIQSERVEVEPGLWVARYSMTQQARAEARKRLKVAA